MRRAVLAAAPPPQMCAASCGVTLMCLTSGTRRSSPSAAPGTATPRPRGPCARFGPPCARTPRGPAARRTARFIPLPDCPVRAPPRPCTTDPSRRSPPQSRDAASRCDCDILPWSAITSHDDDSVRFLVGQRRNPDVVRLSRWGPRDRRAQALSRSSPRTRTSGNTQSPSSPARRPGETAQVPQPPSTGQIL